MAEDPTGLPGSLRAGCVPLLMPLADAGVKAAAHAAEEPEDVFLVRLAAWD
jgi:hypothetical protein